MPPAQLPAMLGNFDRFNIHAEYWWRSGWTLTLRHRHGGDAVNCTHVVVLEGLSSDEVLQAVEDWITTGRERFTWDSESGSCRPDSFD
jgi:hypothetical protein